MRRPSGRRIFIRAVPERLKRAVPGIYGVGQPSRGGQRGDDEEDGFGR